MRLNHYKFRELLDLKKEENSKFTTKYLYQLIGAENSGIGYETLNAYRKGNIKEPNIQVLFLIANAIGCDVFELIEDGEYYKNSLMAISNNTNLIKTDKTKIDIPYFENIYACAGAGLINYEDTPKPITFNREFLETQLNMKNFKNVHIIKLKGNSMEPTFKSGTFLMVNPFENEANSVENGSIYVVRYYEDVMVKRVVRNNKTKEILLHSDNKIEHPSIEIKAEDENDFQIIGRVIANFNFI